MPAMSFMRMHCSERGLGIRQITGLQCLAEFGERTVGIVCNARGKAGGERREGLLGGAQIARLQGVGQSLDILTTLLPGIAWDGL